ncbi:MAG: carboxypeptidase-like regulatory domain-containing protein [Bacteroidetes bacterium]|nr:carboxypeptidase-like regulatory domain-containing protein [Bacteroidota bacterium]
MTITILAYGQKTTVKGKVTDATTQEPIAFASVVFNGTTQGTTSNFEGYFELSTSGTVDSISVAFLGYQTRSKPLQKGTAQTIDFQLEPMDIRLDAIEILPGENPAHRIIRNLWAHKDQNDMRALATYNYESYTKVQIDVDNINPQFRDKPIMKPFAYLFDSLDIIAGEDGNPILPIYVSETISDFYCQAVPPKRREHIKGTHVTGVGMEDGTFISQFAGSSFHQYNFYDNSLVILEHNVVSPIARESFPFYIHILEDSLWIGHKWCYQIRLVPKRSADLVFSGTIWIQDTTWALVKLSVELSGDANVNFVDRLKVQQELAPTAAGPWLPVKTRIMLDLKEPTKERFGMLAKVYISNNQIQVNQIFDEKTFAQTLSMDALSQTRDDAYWQASRHEVITADELKVYGLVDTIRNFPRVRSYIEIAKILTSGYIKLHPKLEFGSFLLSYGMNPVEQHRFRVGLRTTGQLSKRYTAKAYLAYGVRDNRWKYGAVGDVFIHRKTWTKTGYQYKHDLEGLGAPDDYEEDNPMMAAAAQLGLLARMNQVELHRLWFHTDLHRSLTQKVVFTTKQLMPEGRFVFAYYPDPYNKDLVKTHMRITELALETRWAPLETKLVNDNRRTRLDVNKAPSFTFRYSIGIKGVLGGDFGYHKLRLQVNQIARLGVAGRGEYLIVATKVFTPLPYLLLDIYPGNETFIRTLATYNLMDFFEFVADRSLMIFYVHHFDGLIMNRIPYVNRLKWRLVLSGKMALGGLSGRNRQLLPPFDVQGRPTTPVNSLQPWQPYWEVGYGFENIFKFIRIQAYHRLSYTEGGQNTFGVKGSVYFNF